MKRTRPRERFRVRTPEHLEERVAFEPNTGCWLWTKFTNSDGYGACKARGVAYLAHRLSWELHRGPVPEGKLVLHKCDTRACCNPSHLFLGDQFDNMRDASAKGRTWRGKLTVAQVREIRQLCAASVSTVFDVVHPKKRGRYAWVP